MFETDVMRACMRAMRTCMRACVMGNISPFLLWGRSKMTSRLKGEGGGDTKMVTVCDIILREGGGGGSNVTSHILKNIKNMFFQFIQK